MNGNEGTRESECLWNGDPRVSLLLGAQKRPAEGECVRRSRFVFSMYHEGRYLVFNTLTRKLLSLPPRFIDYFSSDRLFPPSVLSEAVPAGLYKDRFLVPERTREDRLYMELKDVMALKEDLPRGIVNYVILPTTACNARCFYCFEKGMRYRKMSGETVEDTLKFILRHKPAGDKKIHLHWFGGEPMCAPENIDRICEGLALSGVGFEAEMTSNGSLFTEQAAKKAAEKWKVSRIQITLDGMAEEYARRKRYTAGLKDPFETVIRGMHLLIAEGIGVTVRLNADENNLGEILRAVDYLKEEFSGEERKKLRVYAHSLFGRSGEGLDVCPAGAGTDALEERVTEINDYIYRQGLAFRDLGELFTFKTHYCMVTSPEYSVLIDAEGQLNACDAMPEGMRYGSVGSDIDPEAWSRVAAPCQVRGECARCVFLPQCTEFDRCPNRMPYDECRRQEKRKLESDLLFAWGVYRDGQRRTETDNKAQAETD